MKPYIINATIALLVIVFMLFAFPNGCKRVDTTSENLINTLNKENVALQVVVDSIKKANISLIAITQINQKKIDSLSYSDALLKSKYQDNLKEIQKIKDEYEKLRFIDKFSSAQILEWFASNYPDY